MLDFIELFILGIGVGSFGALVGIGGGLIMVPLFMYFMMPPSGSTFTNVQEVVGTSLFGVLLNALSGTWAYFRQKRIILSVAMPFALATVPGAFLGSYVSEWFSGPAFSITFGASLAFLGCFMYWSSRNKAANRSADEFDPNELPRSKIWLGIGCSFFVGFISSILGIGGGVVHVPMMVFLLGFPPLVAVATSTFVLMVSAAIGAKEHGISLADAEKLAGWSHYYGVLTDADVKGLEADQKFLIENGLMTTPVDVKSIVLPIALGK